MSGSDVAAAAGAPPLPLENRRRLAEAAVDTLIEALQEDLFPPADVERVFGIQMVEGLWPAPMAAWPTGALMLGVWKHLYLADSDSDSDCYSCSEMNANIKPLVVDAMLAGQLPAWVEERARRMAGPSAYVEELARRGFRGIPYDTAVLDGLRGPASAPAARA